MITSSLKDSILVVFWEQCVHVGTLLGWILVARSGGRLFLVVGAFSLRLLTSIAVLVFVVVVVVVAIVSVYVELVLPRPLLVAGGRRTQRLDVDDGLQFGVRFPAEPLGRVIGRSRVEADAAFERHPQQVVGGAGHVGTSRLFRHETAFHGPAFAQVVGGPLERFASWPRISIVFSRVSDLQEARQVEVLGQISNGRVRFADVRDRKAARQDLQGPRQSRWEHQAGTVAQADVGRQKNCLEVFGVAGRLRHANDLNSFQSAITKRTFLVACFPLAGFRICSTKTKIIRYCVDGRQSFGGRPLHLHLRTYLVAFDGVDERRLAHVGLADASNGQHAVLEALLLVVAHIRLLTLFIKNYELH